MTHEPSALAKLAERFIASEMKWSLEATEQDKLIAVGNVRGFVGWVESLPQDPLSDAETAMIDAAWKRHIGTPISELSGRPGDAGFDRFTDIAETWGH